MKPYQKILYYVLNLTWGLPMTLIGLAASVALIATGRMPIRNAGCWRFIVGDNWGGVSLGLCTITDSTPNYHTIAHEYGHSLQNALWGPLFIFVIAIPSVFRYWLYRWQVKHHKKPLIYEGIWFESQASRWGIATHEDW